MKQITSIGEILFDVYPERKTLGGAPFNFIYHIRKLSAAGNFISRVGGDKPGREILGFLNKHEVPTEFIQIDGIHPTGAANANLDSNKIPHWKIETETAYDYIELSQKVLSLIDERTSCLYFGTLAQRSHVSAGTIGALFGRSTKYFCDLNIRQDFFTKEIIDSSLKAADVVKLNIEELDLVNGMLIRERSGIEGTARRLMQSYGIDLLCITQGENGSYLFKGEESDHCAVRAENVVDTVGAGDAFAAVLCLGYLKGWELKRLNRLASEFAAKIVAVPGALPESDSVYNEFKKEINDE